tara:strand:+ start:6147 stop:7250 length:1104 start_codon:yes stop_codon:yes gene_type:complete
MKKRLKISTKKNILNFLKKNSKKKILIITGKKSFFGSKANKIFQKYKVIFKSKSYPEIEELKSIYFKVKKFSPDIVIAVGGGSVLDYAKIVSILNPENIKNLNQNIKNNNQISNSKNFNLIAIPTTAGSGAEITSNAVIYINKKKFSFEGKNLIPDLFFLCPFFVHNNPFKLKASSGFDAISQSIESILSLRSNKLSLTFAIKSLKLSVKNYINFLHNKSLDRTTSMVLSSHLSGKAISISKTIAPHAISYPFTSIYGLSHGHAVSLNLEKFLYFNYKNIRFAKKKFDIKRRYKILFQIFSVKSIKELCHKIKIFKKKALLHDDYNKLGINIKKDINNILAGVNILRLKNNPIPLKKEDLKKIILNK